MSHHPFRHLLMQSFLSDFSFPLINNINQKPTAIHIKCRPIHGEMKMKHFSESRVWRGGMVCQKALFLLLLTILFAHRVGFYF